MGAHKGIKNHLEDIGKQFGSLTLINIAREDGRTWCYFKCICGNIRRTEYRVTENPSPICNCKKAKDAAKGGRCNKKYENINQRIYQIWENMKQRCYNPNYKRYKDYGGRGIVICKKWLAFVNFEKWALSNGYSDSLTLNRIKNNKNYTPSNCNWITNFKQQENTRKTVTLTHNGKTLHLSEWSRITGIHRTKLSYRKRKGWTTKQILEIV